MPLGPGKYDHLATLVREQAGVDGPGGVVVIVMGGKLGQGFSMQADLQTTLMLPNMLEDIAKQIREAGGL
jgi:hypothetical protein